MDSDATTIVQHVQWSIFVELAFISKAYSLKLPQSYCPSSCNTVLHAELHVELHRTEKGQCY